MNQVFKIAVCDDDEKDREQIKTMIEEVCTEEKIRQTVSEFASAGEVLEKLKNGSTFDLFFLDVLMPQKDGMELAHQLRKDKNDAAIVFISANKEMALLGYEVSAVRYLAKPLEPEKLKEAIVCCYEQKQSNREILLPVNGGMKKIMPNDIYYIEIVGRKSRIKTKTEEWDTSLSIGELEKILEGKGFIRCHQSFLVNCRHVHMFRTSSMELTGGKSIPISKHRIKEVRQAFFDYMKN